MALRLRRWRVKKDRSICPYDEVVGLLQGGLQQTPKWFNSVKKYPPEQMWQTPGKLPRPAEYFKDRNRKIMESNPSRPDWVPSLKFSTVGAQAADAFTSKVHGFDPDVEFTACQAWFMRTKGMDQDEAYEQARFKMRDLIRQKQRVWEVYYRTKFDSNHKEQIRHSKLWQTALETEVLKKKSKSNLTAVKYQRIREELIDKHKVRAKMRTSVGERIKMISKLAEEHETELNDDPDPSKRVDAARKLLQERETFNYAEERKLQLARFVEYCDHVARNPQLGLKDPTEYLVGMPKDVQQALLEEMAVRTLPANFDPKRVLESSTKERAQFAQDPLLKREPLANPSDWRASSQDPTMKALNEEDTSFYMSDDEDDYAIKSPESGSTAARGSDPADWDQDDDRTFTYGIDRQEILSLSLDEYQELMADATINPQQKVEIKKIRERDGYFFDL